MKNNMTRENVKKADMQEAQYTFPYHYIPHIDSNGTPRISRRLLWGLEYLCYQQYIKEKVMAMEPVSVLEVGCGDGYFIGGLPAEIKRVGVDTSEKAIAFAKAFHPGCVFVNSDAKEVSGKFQVVAAIEVLEHIPDEGIGNFINTLASKVEDNGCIILSVPTTVVPVNKKHHRHYTLELLQQQLKQCDYKLNIVEVNYIYAKPWWYDLFARLLDNKLFSLEIKPLMKFAHRKIVQKYLTVNAAIGNHLVAIIFKDNIDSQKNLK